MVNPASNDFDDSKVEATLSAFSITPSICPITYSCSVTRSDGTTSGISCSDFMGGLDDLSTLTDSTPVTFSISADTNDYLAKTPITPGTYIVEFTATDTTTQSLSTSAKFEFEFTDPCAKG